MTLHSVNRYADRAMRAAQHFFAALGVPCSICANRRVDTWYGPDGADHELRAVTPFVWSMRVGRDAVEFERECLEQQERRLRAEGRGIA